MKRALLVLAWLVPSLAAADQVTVKGTVLEGKVKKISTKEIVMETVYGKGDLTIKTADVTAIHTDVPFHVYQTDDGQAVGPIVGLTPTAVTVAQESGTAEVPFDNIDAAPREAGPDANWFSRRAVESPWWSGNVDFALATVDSTTNTLNLATGFGLKRERGGNRSLLDASYRRSTSRPDGDDGAVTQDEIRGLLRHEHDFTKRIFGFGSVEAEHDGIENVALRLIPKLGAGYKIFNTEDTKLSVDAGVAWVSQRYFSSSDDRFESYFAAAFGAESDVKLPWLGMRWTSRADYLPSVTDWTDDYRLRGETALLIPIIEQLSFKAALVDEYNSVPAEDSSSNSLATLFGLSLIY